MRRVSWRLMPFLLAAYLIAYIDRVNVGFAALQMNKAVGLDPKTYGLGAGIFFIGYFIFEVPSNLALQRFGARTWIARIMISWGAGLGGLRPDRRADLVPGAALPAGRRRSRLLPRRDPLFHLLVPGALPRHHRRHLHGGDPGGRPDRLADLGRHSLYGRHPGAGRLAVDLPARGRPRRAAGHRRLRLADRPARTCDVAQAGAAQPGSPPSSPAKRSARRASATPRCGASCRTSTC